MWWVVLVVGVLLVVGSIVASMGFFTFTDEKPDRRGGGNNFIDWMM